MNNSGLVSERWKDGIYYLEECWVCWNIDLEEKLSVGRRVPMCALSRLF